MERRTLYFSNILHRYTDELATRYTSTTTLIDKYYEKFDTKNVAKACEKIGRNPNHKDYLKYKGKTAWQIEQDWKAISDKACEIGTAKHAIAEDSIKAGTGHTEDKTMKVLSDATDYVKLFTVNDIIDNPNTGLLDFDKFANTEIVQEFPIIYNMLKEYAKQGWHIYSELGVYHPEFNISGLLDAPIFKGNMFNILDWKTNKELIRFDSGYYKKDLKGKATNEWIATDKYFLYPLQHLAASTGNKYALQLSIYAWLLEQFGFTCNKLLIGHITHDEYSFEDGVDVNMYGKNKIQLVPIPYLKDEVQLLMEHHKINNIIQTKQTSLF